MTGDDFYALAVQLSMGSTPAEMRSAISRAYYSAYHNAVEFLESVGIALPNGPECHVKVRQILDQSGDKRLTEATSKLLNLRRNRNDADYDLSKQQFEKKPQVDLSIKIADEITSCIKERFASEERTKICDSLRNYSKNILKLQVR
jgi:uncharacterized protein (UPF0332 family)